MRKVIVNVKERTVRVIDTEEGRDETCNFYEAGLQPNGEDLTLEEEIIEHMVDAHDEDPTNIVFE